MYLESKHLRCLLRMQMHFFLLDIKSNETFLNILWNQKDFCSTKFLQEILLLYIFSSSAIITFSPGWSCAGPISWINCIKREQINVCQSPYFWHTYICRLKGSKCIQSELFISIQSLGRKWILKSKFVGQNILKVFSF